MISFNAYNPLIKKSTVLKIFVIEPAHCINKMFQALAFTLILIDTVPL